MSQNASTRWAWVLSGVVIAAALFDLALTLLTPDSAQADASTVSSQLFTVSYTVAFGIVGTLILRQQPRQPIGWLLTVIGLGLALGNAIQAYVGLVIGAEPNVGWTGLIVLWFTEWSWWLFLGPLLFVLLLFPTGQLLSPRWRWVAGLVVVLFMMFLVIASLSPSWSDPISGRSIPNPLARVLFAVSFDTIQVPWAITLLVTATLCAACVLLRYRRSNSVEREQIKWFFFACGVFLAAYTGVALTLGSDWRGFIGLLFSGAILLIPISIGIAIFKYHLYDIDIIIRRTLIYGALTVILAIVYFGSVLLFQEVLRALTGQISDLAIVGSTLVIAALFAPLRNGIQRAIDRRLYRRKYDAALVLANFGTALRAEVDLNHLKEDLLAVVEETMQPASASLWLRDSKRGVK